MLSVRSEDRQWPQPWLWLLFWTLLGAVLRLTNLDAKPPWTDEFRTLVFSLGNSFQSVPLDRVITDRDLFAPLIPNYRATLGDIVRLVSSEDRQPPIYFAIAYLWMKLFPTAGGLVNLWGARALPAVLGSLTIPCVYIGTYLTFRRCSVELSSPDESNQNARSIANFTAAMLAVSPYSVFISQEARHYSLAIVWVTISINCLAIACRYLYVRQQLPLPTTIVWITVNILGIGTHYLYVIAVIAQIGTLLVVWWLQSHQNRPTTSALAISKRGFFSPIWYRIGATIVLTAAGGAGWWWLLAANFDRRIPGWIDNEPHKLIDVFNPFFQIVGAAVSMLSLLLVEVIDFPPLYLGSDEPIDLDLPIAIGSGILMLVFFAWVTPLLYRGIQIQLRQQSTRIETISILCFTLSSIGLYLIIPWLTGIDITRGARYHFVYFPGLMMLIGLGLASAWESQSSIAKWVSGKQAVTIVLLMGAIGSTIVVTNYGYHKYYRPEQIVPMMRQSAPTPVLIATTHNSLVQVGEIMGLAWEMHRTKVGSHAIAPKFLLAHQAQKICEGNTSSSTNRNCPATKILRETIDRIPTALDVWLVNFYARVNLPATCARSKQFTKGVYGYRYRLDRCQPIIDNTSQLL